MPPMVFEPIPVSNSGVLEPPDPTTVERLKKEYGIYDGNEFEAVTREKPVTNDIVEGLLGRSTVNILVGDSGVGKTPLSYQLGMAIAAGAPFLGFPSKRSRVLLLDFENSWRDSRRLMQQQRQRLGLAAYPAEFLLWPAFTGPTDIGMRNAIQLMYPDLVILDSLRSYCPEMESDNTSAARQIAELRRLAIEQGTAILLVHHVSKRQYLHLGGLETGRALDWLFRAAGARALINQTDLRMAVAPRHSPDEDSEWLVLRGYRRACGEVGPFLLRPVIAAEDTPLGYERCGRPLSDLGNPAQETAYKNLPELFSYVEARQAYGKQDSATRLFLHKLMRLGLLEKLDRGLYRKYQSSDLSEVWG